MEYDLLSDELLIKLLRVDDENAYREIYTRYWKILFNTAQRKLKTDEEAEELVQDVLLALWERRGVHQINALQGYLLNALKYRVIDHYRDQDQANRYRDFTIARPASDAPSPEDLMDYSEIIRIFEQALLQLPQKTAQIFRMSRIDFCTTREISQALSIPERTVEYHITQSLRLMRQQLKDYLPVVIIQFICCL